MKLDRIPENMGRVASQLIAMASALTSAEQVRAEMKCSSDDFRDYCAARKQPTQPEIETLVAIIVREQSATIAKNRQLLARIRARTGRG